MSPHISIVLLNSGEVDTENENRRNEGNDQEREQQRNPGQQQDQRRQPGNVDEKEKERKQA